jgi:hypothetical protein
VVLDRKVLAALALVLAVVSVYATHVADPDLWGHLRYGQFLAENGLDVPDPFAYTSAGLQWYGHEYLAQITLWQAYAWGGALGLVILKCLIGGLAILCLYGALRQAGGDARTWAPIFILTAGIVGRCFLFRPQLFSFLFFSFCVLIVFHHLMGRRGWLWTLPPVLALWANLHGAFLAGLGAVGLGMLLRGLQSYWQNGLRHRALFRDIFPLGLTLVACAAASLLNPLGWRLWIYLLTEMTHDTNRRYIEEWQPLQWQTHPWSVVTLTLLLAGLAFAAMLAQARRLRPRQWRCAGITIRSVVWPDRHAALRPVDGLLAGLPPWVWLLSCAPLTLMALQSVRHIPILTIWAAPVLALLAKAAVANWSASQIWQRGWLAFTGLVGVVALVTTAVAVQNPEPNIAMNGGAVLGQKNPVRVTAFLRANELKGNVYNPLWWGSYMTWELYPDIQVSMDGRNVTLFPVEMVRENLTFYLEGANPKVPLRYSTDFLLVPQDSPMLGKVKNASWFRIYEDEDSVLFVRASNAGVIERYKAGELVRPQVQIPKSFE